MAFVNKSDVKRIMKMASTLYEVQERLQEMLDAYQEKLEARSDKWMESEAGEQAQEFVDGLEQAAGDAEAFAVQLEDIVSNFEA